MNNLSRVKCFSSRNMFSRVTLIFFKKNKTKNPSLIKSSPSLFSLPLSPPHPLVFSLTSYLSISFSPSLQSSNFLQISSPPSVTHSIFHPKFHFHLPFSGFPRFATEVQWWGEVRRGVLEVRRRWDDKALCVDVVADAEWYVVLMFFYFHFYFSLSFLGSLFIVLLSKK